MFIDCLSIWYNLEVAVYAFANLIFGIWEEKKSDNDILIEISEKLIKFCQYDDSYMFSEQMTSAKKCNCAHTLWITYSHFFTCKQFKRFYDRSIGFYSPGLFCFESMFMFYFFEAVAQIVIISIWMGRCEPFKKFCASFWSESDIHLNSSHFLLAQPWFSDRIWWKIDRRWSMWCVQWFHDFAFFYFRRFLLNHLFKRKTQPFIYHIN